MRRKRRTHKPEFKAKVALAAIQGDLTMAELVKKCNRQLNHPLTLKMIWKLHDGLGIPAESLIKPPQTHV